MVNLYLEKASNKVQFYPYCIHHLDDTSLQTPESDAFSSLLLLDLLELLLHEADTVSSCIVFRIVSTILLTMLVSSHFNTLVLMTTSFGQLATTYPLLQ